MSLKNYPIKLNDIVLPFSDNLWSEDYSNIQNVNTSEVGTLNKIGGLPQCQYPGCGIVL